MPEKYNRLVKEGNLRRDSAQEAALGEFERIRKALEGASGKNWFRRAPEPPRGLYIWGGVGRGKSMLMDFFVETLDKPVRRAHFHAFMQDIHARLQAARIREQEDALAPVAEEVAASIKVLALDEMQITDITDAMLVGRLLEALLAAGVVIVTTSNRPPDDLYKNGLNRDLFLPFIELMKARMVIHELDGLTDYRKEKLSGEESYFTPLNAHSREQIEMIWERLTLGQGEPLRLTVNKHEVQIRAFHNGIARSSFYDLCGKPLGPADYLALAGIARVLILEDIPQLGRNNFNEARRFVILIDALYEARVRLVCSAAAAPEYLYVEGAGSFDFERTVSRMREMQSVDWV